VIVCLDNITVFIMYRNIHFIVGGQEESWKIWVGIWWAPYLPNTAGFLEIWVWGRGLKIWGIS